MDRPPPAAPEHQHEKYQHLIAAAQRLPPITVAVMHPCDDVSLQGAVEAQRLGLIAPILVGPPARIQGVADALGIDISALPLIASAHSHDSAAKAVALVRSTIEAAALCKIADRGQITGATLDGPLALHNAIDLDAAAIKHIVSPVAGHANVLVVPDVVSGNILAKSLSFLAGADSAEIVLGAEVPIILISRADSLPTRLAPCAVASLVAAAKHQAA